MSDEEIEAMAWRLEGAARIKDAKFRIETIWESDHETVDSLLANRAGFLRLAALLLRGAVADENVPTIPLRVFENEAVEPFFDKMERRESLAALQTTKSQSPWRDKLALVSWAFVCFVLAMVFVAGLIAIFWACSHS